MNFMTRGSGILLHISSLPSEYGIGDMGPEAYTFAHFLSKCGQSFWQILPVTPTELCFDNSPYRSSSSFAGNPLFISPELLVREGLLNENEMEPLPSERFVDFRKVIGSRDEMFDTAFQRFDSSRPDFLAFCECNSFWLDDFSLFSALRDYFRNKRWIEWPEEIRGREKKSIEAMREELFPFTRKHNFVQYIFWKQWGDLKRCCNGLGVKLIGDLPLYVDHNSSDVWANQNLFKLAEGGEPLYLAGAPPDYYSETGQLWGNPVYDWNAHRRSGYSWWLSRFQRSFDLFDMVRIDHFRGLVAYWEVSAAEKTAINGRWIPAPAEDLLRTAFRMFSSFPVIAEDLGEITPEVRETMHRFDLPGIRPVIFAFNDSISHSLYAPHNFERNCVACTGTHDNNTVRGWFENEATEGEKEILFEYLGRRVDGDEVSWEAIRLVESSVASIALIPAQDLLRLGEWSRMNLPGSSDGNWRWRVLPGEFTLGEDLLRMCGIYGRV
jgi:4-alpha-glucanotransferase